MLLQGVSLALLWCNWNKLQSLEKNFSFKAIHFVFTGLVKVPFALPRADPQQQAPCFPIHPRLIKKSLLPWENCGKSDLHVHTNSALPQTVNKGSSQLCPLFILIVTVYYEQNYIPKLILQRLRKTMSTEHSTASDRTLTSRGQRGDAAAQH